MRLFPTSNRELDKYPRSKLYYHKRRHNCLVKLRESKPDFQRNFRESKPQIQLNFHLYRLRTLWLTPLRAQGPAIGTLISPWHFGPTYGHLLILDELIRNSFLMVFG